MSRWIRFSLIILFCLYLIFLVFALLLKGHPDLSFRTGSFLRAGVHVGQINTEALHTIRLFLRAARTAEGRQNALLNLLGNILLFLPLGFLPAFFGRSGPALPVLLFGLAFILSVELIQLVSGWGVWDIDDIFLNSVGVLAGRLLAQPFLFLLRQKNRSPRRRK